jgi:hypothetical protein
MKLFICLYATILFAATTVHAQKIFSTNTAQLSFYSKAPLEEIKAINNEGESKMLQSNGQLIFAVLIKGFVFKNELMQEHFNENYLESTKFPKAVFKGYVTNIASIDFTKDGSYNATIAGDLTIHGITQKIQSAATINIQNSKVLLSGKFNINLKDYNITGLYIGTKIAPQVEITVNCKYE